MQKIHIDDFYRKVVPDGTPDCEPDPGFNYDKARKTTYLFLEIIFGQVFVDKIHVGFNQQVNCILPCHGGKYFSQILKIFLSCPATKGSTWTTSLSALILCFMRRRSSFSHGWKMTTQHWGNPYAIAMGLKTCKYENISITNFKGLARLQITSLVLSMWPPDTMVQGASIWSKSNKTSTKHMFFLGWK